MTMLARAPPAEMDSPEDARVEKVSLDSCPIEVFLMICDLIDADTLIRSLMLVNKRFYGIIGDNYLWKRRALRNYRFYQVAFMLTDSYNEDTFNWKKFAWHTEMEKDCWSNHETNTTKTVFRGPHFSEVDAVILTKNSGDLCLSASRDRSICLWNTLGTVTNPVVHKPDSHTGWIWDLETYDENNFLSCSWDSSVKLWNLDNFSQNAEPMLTFTTDTAVLSITSKNNFVAAGLYTPKVIAFDPRDHEKRLFELISHKRSVIDLCLVEENYLISLSEDKTLSICDLRTRSTLKSLEFAKRGIAFPMCASYYDNVLFIGDSRYDMHWMDCSNGMFEMLMSTKFLNVYENDNLRRYKLNSIKCTNYGSIIAGGNGGAIYILAPTSPPQLIAKIVDCGSEITSIDYQNNTLVVGYVNSDVHVWKKK